MLDEIIELIKSLIQQDPNFRPSAEYALNRLERLDNINYTLTGEERRMIYRIIVDDDFEFFNFFLKTN